MKRPSALHAILPAWLVVGVLDISSAIVIWYQRGTGLRRGLQGIAAGILGPKSVEGGIATALLGLAIHFFIALAVVSIFYLASRKIGLLLKQPLVAGALYGIVVYLVMYWVVLPTVFPAFRHRIGNEALAIAIHISLIGLPTAFIISRYSSSE